MPPVNTQEGTRMRATKTVPEALAIVTVGLLLLSFAGAGCYPTVAPVPGELSSGAVASASTRWPGVTAKSLSGGRDLFVAKCNGCHGYPNLVDISEERWPGVMDKMGAKAHLVPDDRDAVLHYVLASRSEQPASR
jgi:hypothetical protein